MRVSAIASGMIIAVSTLQPIHASEPQAAAPPSAAEELAQLKRLAAELSTQIENLEQKINPQPAAKQFTTAYKVEDIVKIVGDFAVAYDFESLMYYIQTQIAPEHWEGAGGPGTMAPYRANLSLVVSATPEVHEQISQWLEKMRTARKQLDEAQEILDEYRQVSHRRRDTTPRD